MKPKELRDLTAEELAKKSGEIKSELMNLRFQAARKVLENPMRLRVLRKDIARINTILTEEKRQIEHQSTRTPEHQR
jgi:large subunit ribosomal protein L29